ncbi:MAG TPA: hypothetical protein O0X39_07680 [Methanocorpusculum sp.]|nr:hypothetical protein [Methanocorpusculum sp.]
MTETDTNNSFIEFACTAADTIGNIGNLLRLRQEDIEQLRQMQSDAEARHRKELSEAKKIADLYKIDRDAFEAENIELRKAACVEECTQMHFRLSEIRKTLEQLKQDNKRLAIENRELKAKLENLGGNYYETE